MYAKSIDIILPEQNVAIGFDFQVGDLVTPYGKGESKDILLNCGGERPVPINQTVSRNLMLSFAHDGGGVLHEHKNISSALHSVYEAPENGYHPNVFLVIRGQ